MMGRWWVGVIAVPVALACSSDGSGPGDGGTTGDIIVRNNFYDPTPFPATVNQTVVWGWSAGAVEHTVTFNDGPTSPTQSSGSFQRTFTVAGSYPYFCQVHGAAVMSGVVNVNPPAGGGGGGGGGGGNGGGGGYGGL